MASFTSAKDVWAAIVEISDGVKLNAPFSLPSSACTNRSAPKPRTEITGDTSHSSACAANAGSSVSAASVNARKTQRTFLIGHTPFCMFFLIIRPDILFFNNECSKSYRKY